MSFVSLSSSRLLAIVLLSWAWIAEAHAAGPPSLSCPEATGREATIVLPKQALPEIALDGGWLVVSTAAVACVGQASWNATLRTITVYGDDPLTSNVDGARPGDMLEFQLYDAAGLPVATSFSLILDGEACYGCQPTFTYEHDGVVVVSQMTAGASTSAEPPVAAPYHVGVPYPSPTSHQAALTVQLQASQHVRVVLYDALGREVYRAHDAPLPSGASTVLLPAESLPSGTYLVRISSTSLAATRTFVVAR